MAGISSCRPRRDSHNHQSRVKPTSFRVSLKTRTLIFPTVNTQLCDWWPWEKNTLLQRYFLELCYNASNTVKREVQEKVRVGPRTPRGFRSAREEEEEDRCTRLCLTDVDTFSVSVKGKRKFASRRAVLTATCAQLLPLMSGYFSDVGFSFCSTLMLL